MQRLLPKDMVILGEVAIGAAAVALVHLLRVVLSNPLAYFLLKIKICLAETKIHNPFLRNVNKEPL